MSPRRKTESKNTGDAAKSNNFYRLCDFNWMPVRIVSDDRYKHICRVAVARAKGDKLQERRLIEEAMSKERDRISRENSDMIVQATHDPLLPLPLANDFAVVANIEAPAEDKHLAVKNILRDVGISISNNDISDARIAESEVIEKLVACPSPPVGLELRRSTRLAPKPAEQNTSRQQAAMQVPPTQPRRRRRHKKRKI